jgi:hypothetical protein
VLSIPAQAQRQNTLAPGDFGRWMVRHIDHWFAFAQRLGLGIVHMEEIVLITGCDCTRSWTNVAFLEGQGDDAQASFGVELVDGYGPDASIKWHFSPERIRGALLNQGPEGKVRRLRDLESTELMQLFDPADPTRESVHIYPRISCGPYPQDLAKESEGGSGAFFRPR